MTNSFWVTLQNNLTAISLLNKSLTDQMSASLLARFSCCNLKAAMGMVHKIQPTYLKVWWGGVIKEEVIMDPRKGKWWREQGMGRAFFKYLLTFVHAFKALSSHAELDVVTHSHRALGCLNIYLNTDKLMNGYKTLWLGTYMPECWQAYPARWQAASQHNAWMLSLVGVGFAGESMSQ